MNQVGIYAFEKNALPELSAAAWRRLEPLIVAAEPGLDSATARLLVEGLLYRQLAGCSWAEVPVSDPAEVEAAFGRWRASGLLTQLTEVLRVRLDED